MAFWETTRKGGLPQRKRGSHSGSACRYFPQKSGTVLSLARSHSGLREPCVAANSNSSRHTSAGAKPDKILTEGIRGAVNVCPTVGLDIPSYSRSGIIRRILHVHSAAMSDSIHHLVRTLAGILCFDRPTPSPYLQGSIWRVLVAGSMSNSDASRAHVNRTMFLASNRPGHIEGPPLDCQHPIAQRHDDVGNKLTSIGYPCAV